MSQQSTPHVCVVMPVHNEARYLAQSIESVLAQTYANWQLIVVDNQSTDGSLQIAHDYASRDARIRVTSTPEFYTQLQNHNFSMRQVSPESTYCKMLLSDDWIFPECVRLMVQAAEAHPTIGIVSALRLTSGGTSANSLPYPSLFMRGREFARAQLLSDEAYVGSPTMLLFRSAAVRQRDPFFRESARYTADVDVCYELLKEWDFAFVHQVLTFSRTDNVSISSPSRAFSRFIVYQYAHVRRYGAVFLEPAENAVAQKQFRKAYYSFLAERAVERPGPGFWAYQREILASIDERLSRALLLKHLALEIADWLLNPKKTLSRLLRRRAARRASDSAPPPGARTPLPGSDAGDVRRTSDLPVRSAR